MMLQAAKNAVSAIRSQVAALADRAGQALQAAAVGLIAPAPVLVPVRVRSRRPDQPR